MLDWTAIVLGAIEGVTEFVPISSTGHLLIAEHWLGQRSEFFNVVIQAGAILAVTVIYWRRLIALAFHWEDARNRAYLGKLSSAFLITVVLGLAAKKLGFSLPQTLAPVAWALIIGGIWMIMAEWYAGGQPPRSSVSWTGAVVVGIAQIVAGIFPGTSRSGATIFAAMLAGTSDRSAATEFAFIVGIPTMYAASAYEIYDLLKKGGGHEDWSALATAFVVSTLTAFIVVKWLLGFIKTHRYTTFAAYRILFGLVLLSVAATGKAV